MSRHISGEQSREKKKFTSGNKLGFRYDEESIKQSEKLALDLIKAWTNILNRPDLLMNISSELKNLEGGYNLGIQVENMASEMTSEYIPLQEKSMRIRGSELRKIIKEELKRSMLKEEGGTVLTGKATNISFMGDFDVKVGNPLTGTFMKPAAGAPTFEIDGGAKLTSKDLLSYKPVGIDGVAVGEHDGATYTLDDVDGNYTISLP